MAAGKMEHELDILEPSDIGQVLDPTVNEGANRVKIEKQIVELKEICLKLTNWSSMNLNRFPGAHPVSLSRRA